MGDIRYVWLDRNVYEGYCLAFSYRTDCYYQVNAAQWGMNLELRDYSRTVEKSFTDHLFADWLEDPVAIGAFQGDNLIGVIEGSLEQWHDVFRISNLLVMEPFRKQGVGQNLMDRLLRHAQGIKNCRGAILETQSCNYPAISFYRKRGFLLSRIDLCEYSNEDIQRNEVRLDFFLPFPNAEKEG